VGRGLGERGALGKGRGGDRMGDALALRDGPTGATRRA
jgi:hypothetical protein